MANKQDFTNLEEELSEDNIRKIKEELKRLEEELEEMKAKKQELLQERELKNIDSNQYAINNSFKLRLIVKRYDIFNFLTFKPNNIIF